ncbi:MAG: hypothetical protein JW786_04685 [Desulfobacterales bacterium]|nr:hypothetical protein [Desulfobacterales bacterium]
MTNDKQKPNFSLTIAGQVEKLVTINPQFVKLEGLIGQPIVRSVSIIPEKKYFFKILEAKSTQGKNIRLKLTELKKPKGTIYLLTVENTKKEKGRYFDTIELKTNSKIRPEIKISVYGNVFEKKQKGKKQNS